VRAAAAARPFTRKESLDMKRLVLLAVVACLAAVPAMAQAPSAAPAGPTDPLSKSLFGMFNTAKLNLTQSADKVSEADFAFQPTKEVRTFGQMLAHVANSNYSYCAAAKGEPNPNKDDLEKTRTTKADIVKALNDALTYCEGVYAGMTDAKLVEMIKAGQNEVPRASRLIGNIAHDNEHYGNLVTYMRIKGIVPPSTERAQQMRR
jgi:uncharacterized damage-inducible protein DinB